MNHSIAIAWQQELQNMLLMRPDLDTNKASEWAVKDSESSLTKTSLDSLRDLSRMLMNNQPLPWEVEQ